MIRHVITNIEIGELIGHTLDKKSIRQVNQDMINSLNYYESIFEEIDLRDISWINIEGKVFNKVIFTLSDIERAIRQCPKFIVEPKEELGVDKMLGDPFETIETEMFLFRLFKSDQKVYNEWKKNCGKS